MIISVIIFTKWTKWTDTIWKLWEKNDTNIFTECQIINWAKNQKKWEKKIRKILKTWIEKKRIEIRCDLEKRLFKRFDSYLANKI